MDLIVVLWTCFGRFDDYLSLCIPVLPVVDLMLLSLSCNAYDTLYNVPRLRLLFDTVMILVNINDSLQEDLIHTEITNIRATDHASLTKCPY